MTKHYLESDLAFLPLPRRERAGVRVNSTEYSIPLTLPSPPRGEGFKKSKSLSLTPVGLLFLLAFNLTGCATMLKTTGALTKNQDLVKAGESMEKAEKEFTEEEKYYTGRTVACYLLAGRQPSDNLPLERYLGRVGQTVAQASGKPQQARGWHFILVKGSAPEAFSCPGGFVLVSEALVKLCANEDELAAVLAHESAHVALDHPMQAISAVNRRAAVTELAQFGLKQASKNNDKLKGLTGTFDNAVKEVMKSVAHGYDRGKEGDADQAAAAILADAGYDPRALSSILRKMSHGGATHGDPKARAAAVDQAIAGLGDVPLLFAGRTKRFTMALAAK